MRTRCSWRATSSRARRPASTRCAAASGSIYSERTKHGALIDTELLAKVYLELIGGLQPGFSLAVDSRVTAAAAAAVIANREPRPPRPHAATPEELAAHAAMIASLKEPVWLH